MKITNHLKKYFSVLVVAAAVSGCALDEQSAPTLEVGDEVDESDTPIDEAVEGSTFEELIVDDDPELALESDGLDTLADTIGPAYHLFTRTGAVCRDHCVARDQYLYSYSGSFSSPFYHYNNSKIYADYYIGQTRKQKWEQHRFARAHVDVYCGSSGRYLSKYYGRAKRGREVVRTWICYSGRCRFQGDNVGSMHKGWNH